MRHSPTTMAIISGVTAPGRRMRGRSPVASTTVDSRPTSLAPPSRIRGMRPSRSDSTCLAVVGLGLPERLALGAARGNPQAAIRARAAGWLGARRARESRPALTAAGTPLLRGTIRVRGPGQKASARVCAKAFHSP